VSDSCSQSTRHCFADDNPNTRTEVPIDAVSFPDDTTIDRARLEAWCLPGRTITPIERGLIAQALFALDEAARCKALLGVLRAEKERTAEKRWREEREDEVIYDTRLFNQDPPMALARLKRTAGGLRYLIGRWQHISRCLDTEGALYGMDLIDCVQIQGHSAVIDHLFLSEAAWETFRDALAARPNPHPRDIETICAPDVVPKSIQERALPLWRPDPEEARARLRAIVDRELPPLVALEAELRVRYEEPGLAAAKALALAALTREEADLRRALRSHESAFLKATTALGKLRKQESGPDQRRGPTDALAAAPVCGDRPGPETGVPRRRVPITAPFARTPGAAAPGEDANEAGATQVHGGPVPRNAHRHAPMRSGFWQRPGSDREPPRSGARDPSASDQR
jgi:hypothetical protein